ncbi:MAG: DUF3106 domain-containing protein [Rhodanobacteraceae bacterium]
MRISTLTGLLVATCLLAAPCTVFARTNPAAPPTQSTSRVAPPDADAHALPWSSLSAAQQRVLAPLQPQWNELHPQRQRRLASHALGWATLPPEHQQQIRKRLARWARMTPAQRHQLRENARAFRRLTPAERAKVRAAFRKYQSLSPAERRALRERWRKMTPQQRRHWAAEHPAHAAPPPASYGHR